MQVLRVGPILSSSTSTTTVTFSSYLAAMQAMSFREKYFQTTVKSESVLVTVETHFSGPTCLYSAELPVVDIVFVHGAYGHAISSVASYHGDPPKEELWIRDELPKALGLSSIPTRIFTLGWNANSWLDPHESFLSGGENLLEELRRVRSGIAKRPIVFVGHGIGGLLVKQAVNEMVSFGEGGFGNPVKACFFFAVPQRQGNSEYGFASILATMRAALQQRGGPAKSGLARTLMPRSRQILNLSKEFDNICREFNISTVSFYEERMTSGDLVVPRESAILNTTLGEAYGVDANHRDIARLSKVHNNFTMVLDVICNKLRFQLDQILPIKTAIDTNVSPGPLSLRGQLL